METDGTGQMGTPEEDLMRFCQGDFEKFWPLPGGCTGCRPVENENEGDNLLTQVYCPLNCCVCVLCAVGIRKVLMLSQTCMLE